MKAQEGENNVTSRGRTCSPLDKIRISPLMSKVNGPHEQMGGNTLPLRKW